MMRDTSFVFLAALAILALGACSKSSPDAAPSATAPSSEAASVLEAVKAGQASAVKPGEAPVATGVASEAPGKADEADMVPEAKRTPEVTPEECATACAHATKLSMASMPPDATPDMKSAIEKALTESCPKDCLAKGTKKLVACILKAKSGMELAANCQK
jgi:hypothetical protein